MSRKQTKHPGRRLLTLLLAVVVGYSALAFGAATHRTTMTPGLALDLEGGTQIILTPTTTDGSEIIDENVNEAIEVIRQRVDASGVSGTGPSLMQRCQKKRPRPAPKNPK